MWSVPWPDRVVAYVAPGEVAWRRLRGGLPWARKPAASWRLELGPSDTLATRLAGCAEAAMLKGAAVQVVLSNHHVRYGVLASDVRLTGGEEREAAARAALRDTYQGLVDDWRVTLGDMTADLALAAGVAATLVEELKRGFEALGARVVGIEPLMAHVLNLSRSEPDARDAHWLACVEPSRIVLARIEGDAVRFVRSRRARPDDLSRIGNFIHQVCLQEGLASGVERVIAFRRAIEEAPTRDADGVRWVTRVSLQAPADGESSSVAEPS